MKIIRFRGSHTGKPYAYVKCWPWEKIAILRKMKRRVTGLYLVTWEPGPKAWGASFMIASVYRRHNQKDHEMREFNEAADALHTAQLKKLEKELRAEHIMHVGMKELAIKRGERLVELARVANELKDERDSLVADSRRLAFMIERRASVEFSERAGKYWLQFPDGFIQSDMFGTPIEAIDAAMESENV